MHTQSDRHPQFVKITAHTSTAQLAGSTALLSMLLGQRQYETHSNLPLSKDAPVQSIHKHSGGTSEATQGCLLWGEFGISFHNKLSHELLPGFKPMPLQLSESTIQHPAAWQPLTVFDLPKHSHCHLQACPIGMHSEISRRNITLQSGSVCSWCTERCMSRYWDSNPCHYNSPISQRFFPWRWAAQTT